MTHFPDSFHRQPPASALDIRAAESALGLRLPQDYVDFLSTTNGGQGWINEQYVWFHGVHELADMNREYRVSECVSGFLLIGSNGGGEAYGFDMRATPWCVVQIPFIVLDWRDAEHLADSFAGFLTWLATTP